MSEKVVSLINQDLLKLITPPTQDEKPKPLPPIRSLFIPKKTSKRKA